MPAIFGAIPWAAIFALLLQLVGFVIEKVQDKEKLRLEFLKFIAAIDTAVPVKIHDRYKAQLEAIKEEMKKTKVD